MPAVSPQGCNSTTALAHLRRLIAGGAQQLPPERVIAADLGLGRRAVRRALDVLEAEGVIARRQGRGTFVGPEPAPGPRRIARLGRQVRAAEVMEARMLVEPCLARLAAQRATDGDVARLDALTGHIAASTDADARELWDGAFHRLIAQIAGNTLLLGVFDLIDGVRGEADWQALREAARDAATLAQTAAQHRRIVEAVERRAGAEAEVAMRSHLLAIAGHLAAGEPGLQEGRNSHGG